MRWHNNEGDMFEIIIRDASGRKIDVFKGILRNFKKTSNFVLKKYGLRKEKDLDWLKDE